MTVNCENNCVTSNIAKQVEQKRAGRRKHVRHGGTLCSKCLEAPPAPRQRYCVPCHNAAQSASYHRRKGELSRLRAMAARLNITEGEITANG